MASGNGSMPLDLVKRWPVHLLSCPLCANRWELIQRDAHCDPADVLAMENLTDDHFYRMFVANHLERCFACRNERTMVHNLILVTDRHSVHWGNIAIALREAAPLAIYRGPEERKLRAAVVDASGHPRFRLEEIERVDVDVITAEITEDGTVTVELVIPSWCSEARLALTTSKHSVMFPFLPTDEGKVRFVGEGRMLGVRMNLPLSSLTAWVRARAESPRISPGGLG
jgi:hypothetical protein